MNHTDIHPTNLADLALAPVALSLSLRLEQLGAMTSPELALAIAAGTDHDPIRGHGARLLIDLLAHDVDLHQWTLSWCRSGLRLEHGAHSLVLGVSPALDEFLLQDVSA